MKAWAALGTGGRAAVSVVAVGTVVVAGAVLSGWRPGGEEAAPAALLADLPVSEPVATSATPEAEAAPEPVSEPVAGVAAPEITTWVVTAGGHATIGGLGDPDAQILVLLDGAEIGTTRVTRGGEFALVTKFAPNPEPSLLSLVMVLENGERIASDEVIAIGPIAGEALAEAGEGVTEPVAPLALKVTQDGVVPLQPDLQPAVQPGSPDAAADMVVAVNVQTITYASPEVVQIGGTGAPGAFIRLYLDNDPVGPAEVEVAQTGHWQAELPGIAAGLYVLRVDQLDAGGKVTSRFETPFRRETPEALAALTAGEAGGEAAQAEPVAVAAVAVPEPVPATPTASEGEAASLDTAPAPTPVAPEAALATVIDNAPAALSETLSDVAPTMPENAEQPSVTEPAATAPAALPATPAITVTVQPGHTLWAIAREEFGEGLMYVQLFDANRDRIKDPDLIYPGQVVTIPGR